MLPVQILLVQSSYAVVRPRLRWLADRTLERLILEAPWVELGDVDGVGLLDSCDRIIGLLGRPGQAAALDELAARLTVHGVDADWIPAIADAVLDTLAEMIDDGFDQDLEESWAALIELLMEPGDALALPGLVGRPDMEALAG